MAADAGSVLRDDDLTRRHGVLWLTLYAVLLTLPLWSETLIGHSQALNLVWQEAFAERMREGVLYPRWIETTNQGLGSPAFYFYAPLPFWVSSLLDLMTDGRLSPATYVSGSIGLAIWCSGLAMYRLLRAHFAPTSALIAAVLYMALPYHLGIDVWWRAALGELWGFVWPPLMLHGIVRLWQQQRWGWTTVIVATTGLTLSHLPSFLIVVTGAGTLALLLLVLRQDPRRVARTATQAGLAAAVGFTITAGYWLPAITTLDLTDVNGFMTSGQYNYASNFVAVHKPWTLDQSVQGVSLVMLAALAQLYVVGNRCFTSRPWTFTATCWFGLAMLFLLTPASHPLWMLVTPLQRIQFPWRFLLLVDVALVLLCAHLLELPRVVARHRTMRWLLPVLCLATGATWARFIPPKYPPSVLQIIAESALTRADAAEYRTRWTSAKYYRDLRAGVVHVAPSYGSAAVDQVLDDVGGATVLLHHRFFYPDLRAVDAGSGAPLLLRPQAVTGLTLVELPSSGTVVRFEHVRLPQEQLGWLVSLAGLFLAAVAVLWEYRRPVTAAPTP